MTNLIDNITSRIKKSNSQSKESHESIQKWYQKLGIISGIAGAVMLPFVPHIGISLMGTCIGSYVSYCSSKRIVRREDKRVEDELEHMKGVARTSFNVDEDSMNSRRRNLNRLRNELNENEQSAKRAKKISKGLFFGTMIATAAGMIAGLPVAWLSSGLAAVKFFKDRGTYNKVDKLEDKRVEYDNLKNDLEIIDAARSSRVRSRRRASARTNPHTSTHHIDNNLRRTPRPLPPRTSSPLPSRNPRPLPPRNVSQRGNNYTEEQNARADAYINALANMNQNSNEIVKSKVKK